MPATYANVDPDVAGRFPSRTIDGSSDPSSDDCQRWIDEAQSYVDGVLRAGGMTTPYTAPSAVDILGTLIVDYAEGRFRNAIAGGSVTGTDPKGEQLLAEFKLVLDDMRRNPATWAAILGGPVASNETRHVRGHVLDNRSGRTIADGDFAPEYDRNEGDGNF